MAKQHYLMLAHKYNPEKHSISGWYCSEKLDGMRCFWDGGVSRGKSKDSVGYANTLKDHRYISIPKCTGLWSRYGHPIQAPDWFLDRMPDFPLDGELWAGRDSFQSLVSLAKKLEPEDSDWEGVQYKVFDSPSMTTFLKYRFISLPNMELLIPGGKAPPGQPRSFRSVLTKLKDYDWNESVSLLEQEELPFGTEKAEARLLEKLEDVITLDGEGLVLRNPNSDWVTERTHNLLKVKQVHDAEATVIDYIWGLEGKLKGLMGAMIVEDSTGHIFEIGTGFTEEERRMLGGEGEPGSKVIPESHNIRFPRGTIITYRYASLTRDGIPREARYFRRKEL